MSKGKRGKKRISKPLQSPESDSEEQVLPEKPEAAPPTETSSASSEPSAKSNSFFRRRDWLAFALATLISFGVYYYTLAPDLTLEDSGELAVGSMYAGVPHPPGYPVWTLYTWAFTKLPFGNIAWRVALSSAVAAALACGLLALIVSRSAQLILKTNNLFRELNSHQRDAIGLASGITAGLLLAFNGFMWSQAVIVEVYTLGIFTFMAVLALMMRWYYRPKVRWPLYLAYFCFGLCFANHQTLLLAAIGIEAIALLADRKLGKELLFCNCGVYILGLYATLPAEGAPPTSEPGVFILFNVIGISMFALLLGMALYDKGKSDSKSPRDYSGAIAIAVCIYLISAGLFATAWVSFYEEGVYSSAANSVKAWAAINALLLVTIAVFSWFNRGNNPSPILSQWMPMLNTRAAWLLGAAFYLYMPLASMTNPPMNWAYPRTVQGFEHAFTRGQYDRIEPSNITRMFYDRDYTKAAPNTPSTRANFNGGQALVYWDEAAEEFSLGYLMMAFLPLAFLRWMALRERRWIAALTGIFISFTLILIFLLNPTADEQNRHLFKVFFAATHIFIALAAGLGTALIAATLATSNRTLSISLVSFLFLLGILEIFQATAIFKSTEFIIPKAAALIGLSLLISLLLCVMIRAIFPQKRWGVLLALGVGLILLLPARPALSNWAVNEQRGHLFGYWYGHDMFSPPFEIFPEMEKDAILFGGTDPGRFAPTYMIFCESFMPPKYKRDKEFDRRDVYIITQNALADGTYLQYIRAHYNRSAQKDKDFFRNLSDKLDPDQAASRTDALKRRSSLYLLSFFGLMLGAGMLTHASILKRNSETRRQSIGAGIWGGTVILGAFLILPPVAQPLALKADDVFTQLGRNVEQSRRANGVYPKKEIHTPSAADNQIAFNDYLMDAVDRMGRGQLAHNENVTINFPFQCHQCGTRHLLFIDRTRLQLYRKISAEGGLNCPNDNTFMPTPPNPHMQVRGTGSVMAINALLTKVIFETNLDHEFYLEESYPLIWMYPYISPHGIIMKLDAKAEFEITSVAPAPLNPTNAPVQLKIADELQLRSEQDEDSFQPVSAGKFFVEATHTNGMPSTVRIEDGGRFTLAPPESLFVTGERTNVARIKVKMQRIKDAAAYGITHAEVDPDFAGYNFQVNEVLTVFDSIISGSLQPKVEARLRVTEVNAQNGIVGVEIIQGGRYVLMPPRHINLFAANGTPLRMAIQSRRIPKFTEIPEDVMAKDRQFWDEYAKRLIGDAINAEMSVKTICEWIEKTYLRRNLKDFDGDPRFLRDQQGQKGFSNLRRSIGNVYAWRMRRSPKDSELYSRYAREAEYAYRQSFAFGPISPEAVIRYNAFLMELGRYRDAVEVALTFQKLDPLFPQTEKLISQALEAEISVYADANQMDKALETAKLLQEHVPSARHANLVKTLEDVLKATEIYLNRFQRDPANADYFNTAVDVTVQSRQLDNLKPMIDLFESKMTRNERNLAALARAYDYLEDYKNKERVYEEMTTLIPQDPVPWYDLAKARMRLEKTNEAATALLKSLRLHAKSTATDQYNIPALARTNSIFAPLRERPEIQKLLESENK